MHVINNSSPLISSHCSTSSFSFIYIHRDSAYIAVLSSVLSDALSAPSFDLELLYENSIALVALEEVIGVREPRLACSKGYQAALRNTVLQYMQSGQLEVLSLVIVFTALI